MRVRCKRRDTFHLGKTQWSGGKGSRPQKEGKCGEGRGCRVSRDKTTAAPATSQAEGGEKGGPSHT